MLKMDGRMIRRVDGGSRQQQGCGHREAACPLTAVHTGRFNLVVNRRDQGWAPQILPQLPWMGGAPLPARGINRGRDGQRGGGEGHGERKRIQLHRGAAHAAGLQGGQAGVIRRKVKHDESCSTL